MPKDKKKNTTQPGKPQKGLGSANNYFETAEELANRHPESKERQGKPHKSHQATPNPEHPNP
ncbi:MAG: hypothetical protein GX956_08575 [Firmicutes bacterium]|nr:hypothetical protein [Bacillota bacterium]